MKREKLLEIIKKHQLWLENNSAGERANLAGANLSKANFYCVDLRDANLQGANLRNADLSKANLARASLSGADLRGADLNEACLYMAHLRNTNLLGANLNRANLQEADFREADFDGAYLRGANLQGADLSGTTGILDQGHWLYQNFQQDNEGVLVYKRIGTTEYGIPNNWKIKPGEILEETPDSNRCINCGCGVNFGTLRWCKRNYTSTDLWLCRIHWIDLATVVVPYNTDGKARCSRLELIKIVE